MNCCIEAPYAKAAAIKITCQIEFANSFRARAFESSCWRCDPTLGCFTIRENFTLRLALQYWLSGTPPRYAGGGREGVQAPSRQPTHSGHMLSVTWPASLCSFHSPLALALRACGGHRERAVLPNCRRHPSRKKIGATTVALLNCCTHGSRQETTTAALLFQTAPQTRDLAIYGSQAMRPRCFTDWSKRLHFGFISRVLIIRTAGFTCLPGSGFRFSTFFRSVRPSAHENNALCVKMVFACSAVGI